MFVIFTKLEEILKYYEIYIWRYPECRKESFWETALRSNKQDRNRYLGTNTEVISKIAQIMKDVEQKI